MSDLFELPSLGADMEHGTVLEWLVQPGEVVERGSVVAVVETEKADVDVEIWQEGTIAEFLVDIGEEVSVGTPILRLGVEQTDTDASPPADAAPSVLSVDRLDDAVHDRVAASPRARRVANERGIDLASVVGSGPEGAVLERDLAVASAPPGLAPPDPPSTDSKPLDRAAGERQAAMRGAIAERMSKANTEIPHYHLELDIDLGPTLTWLEEHNRNLDVSDRVLPAAVLLKATAAAARAVPALNGSWVDGSFKAAIGTDVAVVVSLRRGGLVTPKIADGADKTVDQVMAELKEIVAGARRGSLRSSWMSGAGITVTNLGDNGADRVNGVIFPPQVALVGFGKIADRPFAVDGAVVVRPTVTASLAADHRATDGSVGSRFLHALVEHLKPERLESSLETEEKP